jgi:hypothetical protein
MEGRAVDSGPLELAHEKVQKFGGKILTPITVQGGQRFFRCYDPDENVIELFEVGRGARRRGVVTTWRSLTSMGK